jgi:hypothetical protein
MTFNTISTLIIRAIIDSVNVDRQTTEDFKELKVEMGKYHLEGSECAA